MLCMDCMDQFNVFSQLSHNTASIVTLFTLDDLGQLTGQKKIDCIDTMADTSAIMNKQFHYETVGLGADVELDQQLEHIKIQLL